MTRQTITARHLTMFGGMTCVLFALGCGSETTESPESPTAQETSTEDHGHSHDHGHKHGPSGYPVVTLDDGTEIEWDLDTLSGSFLVIPPADMAEDVESVVVKTMTEGEEKTYEFTKDAEPGRWALEDKDLSEAMTMGDAVERTLIMAMSDGRTVSGAVAHFEGH